MTMDSYLTDEERQWKQMCEKATPGPWIASGSVYWARVNDGNIDDWPWARGRLPLGECNWCKCAPVFTSVLIKSEVRDGYPYHLHHIAGNDNWRGVTSLANGETIAGNYDYEEGGIASSEADANFIAASRTALPALLSKVAQQAEEIEGLRKSLQESRDAHDAEGRAWTLLNQAAEETIAGLRNLSDVVGAALVAATLAPGEEIKDKPDHAIFSAVDGLRHRAEAAELRNRELEKALREMSKRLTRKQWQLMSQPTRELGNALKLEVSHGK